MVWGVSIADTHSRFCMGASVILLFALSSGGRATALTMCLRYALAVEEGLNYLSQEASAYTQASAGASSWAYKQPDRNAFSRSEEMGRDRMRVDTRGGSLSTT